MDILEIREEIENCTLHKDCNGYLQKVNAEVTDTINQLRVLLDKHNFAAAKYQIDRLKFLYSIQKAAESKLEDL
jgi:DnaJ-domain-containing protein 1